MVGFRKHGCVEELEIPFDAQWNCNFLNGRKKENRGVPHSSFSMVGVNPERIENQQVRISHNRRSDVLFRFDGLANQPSKMILEILSHFVRRISVE